MLGGGAQDAAGQPVLEEAAWVHAPYRARSGLKVKIYYGTSGSVHSAEVVRAVCGRVRGGVRAGSPGGWGPEVP
ncbi:hypothetical protein GCM10010270_81180 [Streptomyces violaceus]|nr:hypothetical protein GCM10010270_81180 [Streptomyces janthinus]